MTEEKIQVPIKTRVIFLPVFIQFASCSNQQGKYESY